jgi:tetratricopeptide (TPR) repeat protein
LVLAESLLAESSQVYELAFNVADSRSWMGTTLLELGRLAEARDEFAQAATVMQPFHQHAHDKRASSDYCRLLILQAEADISRGDVGGARRALEESLAVYGKLLEIDPTNTTWLYSALTAETHLLSLVPPGQWTSQERAALERIESKLASSSSGDESDKDYIRLKFRVHNLRDIVLLHQGDPGAALRSAQQTRHEWQVASQGMTMSPELTLIEARVEKILGSALAAAGDAAAARATWQEEAERLDAISTANLSLLAVRRLLAIDLGDLERANDIAGRLQAAGYLDPRADPAYTMSGAFPQPVPDPRNVSCPTVRTTSICTSMHRTSTASLAVARAMETASTR